MIRDWREAVSARANIVNMVDSQLVNILFDVHDRKPLLWFM